MSDKNAEKWGRGDDKEKHDPRYKDVLSLQILIILYPNQF